MGTSPKKRKAPAKPSVAAGPPPDPAIPLRIASLAAVCGEEPLREKWLLAPSRRAGIQWLDSVARSGRPVFNARAKTLLALALDLASPEMARRGLKFLVGPRLDVLVGRLFSSLRSGGKGYLSSLDPGPGLTETLRNALRDLRLAGLQPGDLSAKAFEVEAKGVEMAGLLAAYEKELETGVWADRADVLRMAAQRLAKDPDAALGDALVIRPDDQELAGLEAALWDAIPKEHRRALASDAPGTPPAGPPADAALLRWLPDPSSAPAPVADGTARVFRAAGEANEVREVFRRILAEGIPFDEVEIVCADVATYGPLLFELASRWTAEAGGPPPVTFAEGVPTRYSRPGRALLGWLAWIREGLPRSAVVRLLLDGLLAVPEGPDAPSFTRLGSLARSVPVELGPKAAFAFLDEKIASLRKARKSGRGGAEEDPGDPDISGAGDGAWKTLRNLLAGLFDGMPAAQDPPKRVLQCGVRFLEARARFVSEMDAYARRRLLKEIQGLADCLEDGEDAPGLDVRSRLAELPHEICVGGCGPRPGRVHVSALASGGHSGRARLFVVGLDDRRFPGAGLQDPLLLDGERKGLSEELQAASARVSRKVRSLERMLAGYRGGVTLSYSGRDILEDRDAFPAQVLVSAYRILSGERGGDLDGFLRWTGVPSSFAPLKPELALGRGEWWVPRLCAGVRPADPESAVAARFPRLGRGFIARDARAGSAFTEFDGFVPEAGRDLDPFRKDARALSATRLELLGKCPMDYFFKHVLGLEPPEEGETDPGTWLDPLQKGELLHDVFREFMDRLKKKNLLPSFDRDERLFRQILDAHLREWRGAVTPPTEGAFELQVEELRRTADVFLREEEEFCKGSRPFCFEASIGLDPVESGASPLDVPEPLLIRLPGGRQIRARGRIDRVDEVPGPGERRFTIWDYKTGSAYGYEQAVPFAGGRRVQGALYLALADARVKKAVSPKASVVRFGYFFPNPRAHGLRISWDAGELADGPATIERLCETLARGCFPCSDSADDLTYSDYAQAYPSAQEAVLAALRKIFDPSNEALRPFAELRGAGKAEGGGGENGVDAP